MRLLSGQMVAVVTRACGSITTEMAKGKTPGEALLISAGVIHDALGGFAGRSCALRRISVTSYEKSYC